jgi:hypothetical protein
VGIQTFKLKKADKGRYAVANETDTDTITVAAYSLKQAFYLVYNDVQQSSTKKYGIVKATKPAKPKILMPTDFQPYQPYEPSGEQAEDNDGFELDLFELMNQEEV